MHQWPAICCSCRFFLSLFFNSSANWIVKRKTTWEGIRSFHFMLHHTAPIRESITENRNQIESINNLFVDYYWQIPPRQTISSRRAWSRPLDRLQTRAFVIKCHFKTLGFFLSPFFPFASACTVHTDETHFVGAESVADRRRWKCLNLEHLYPSSVITGAKPTSNCSALPDSSNGRGIKT